VFVAFIGCLLFTHPAFNLRNGFHAPRMLEIRLDVRAAEVAGDLVHLPARSSSGGAKAGIAGEDCRALLEPLWLRKRSPRYRKTGTGPVGDP